MSKDRTELQREVRDGLPKVPYEYRCPVESGGVYGEDEEDARERIHHILTEIDGKSGKKSDITVSEKSP